VVAAWVRWCTGGGGPQSRCLREVEDDKGGRTDSAENGVGLNWAREERKKWASGGRKGREGEDGLGCRGKRVQEERVRV
jgi:hypothetical protein